MIEIYHGDGKGKTTAAVGLAVRAAGRGVPALFVQFLKDGSSGEIAMLRTLPGMTVMHAPRHYGFSFRMNEAEKQDTREMYAALTDEAETFLKAAPKTFVKGAAEQKEKADSSGDAAENVSEAEPESRPDITRLLVLDEVLHAVNCGLLSEARLLHLLDSAGGDTEIVLTGQRPTAAVLERADYVTEMRKEKHPYDSGIAFRVGVEL